MYNVAQQFNLLPTLLIYKLSKVTQTTATKRGRITFCVVKSNYNNRETNKNKKYIYIYPQKRNPRECSCKNNKHIHTDR